MDKRGAMLFFGIFLMVSMIGVVSAEVTSFGALSGLISDKEDNIVNINSSFVEGLEIYGDIYYNENSFYDSQGNYRFVFFSKDINYNSEQVIITNSPPNTFGGYGNRFYFNDENNNINEGFFNGVIKVSPIDDSTVSEIEIRGNYYLQNNQEENYGILTIKFFLDNQDNSTYNEIVILNGYISNKEERISALESWKETVDDFIDSLFDFFDDYEERIESLESSSSGGGGNNVSSNEI